MTFSLVNFYDTHSRQSLDRSLSVILAILFFFAPITLSVYIVTILSRAPSQKHMASLTATKLKYVQVLFRELKPESFASQI
jgi:hypothetical protein